MLGKQLFCGNPFKNFDNGCGGLERRCREEKMDMILPHNEFENLPVFRIADGCEDCFRRF